MNLGGEHSKGCHGSGMLEGTAGRADSCLQRVGKSRELAEEVRETD